MYCSQRPVTHLIYNCQLRLERATYPWRRPGYPGGCSWQVHNECGVKVCGVTIELFEKQCETRIVLPMQLV